MGLSGIDELIWPIVLAHRGASIDRPENTLPAFEAAIAAGADGVELDVRLTADGVAVVLHDVDVSVTTDGHGFVHELPFAQVRGLNAGREGEPRTGVPSLEDALRALSGRACLDVEIKNLAGEPDYEPTRERCADEVVRLLDELSFDGAVVVSSFNPAAIDRVRFVRPAMATGLLTIAAVDPRAALRHAVERGYRFVLPAAGALLDAGPGFVAECHGAGVRVGTWTVDDPATIARLFEWGVDAVVTNDPAPAATLRNAARERSDGPQP